MPYYLISLTYDVGHDDEVTLDINNVEAKNQSDALDKLPKLLERIDHLKGHPQIEAIKASSPNPVPKKIDIKPVPAPPPVDESRFTLERSQKYADEWEAKDTQYKVLVTWKEHRFNETKKVTFLKLTPTDYLVRARVMREIGEWLNKYHNDKL